MYLLKRKNIISSMLDRGYKISACNFKVYLMVAELSQVTAMYELTILQVVFLSLDYILWIIL